MLFPKEWKNIYPRTKVFNVRKEICIVDAGLYWYLSNGVVSDLSWAAGMYRRSNTLQTEFVFTGFGGNFLICHGCQQHWKILQIKYCL